ncbi:MAG: hypothetical protein H0U00_05755 [Actinobacteria bacterium]|nr:hypothetical protein [Actinomycetota bacterium]
MPALTGYDTQDRFYATRYSQGERRVYSIDLSPMQIAAYLPAPDPANPTEGNRRVREGHARSFGEYVREHDDWVSPALLLRAPDIFEFEAKEEIAGTQFGVLAIPRLARSDIRILDGQHRILGIHLAIQAIAKDLEKQRDLVAKAKKTSSEPAVIEQLKATIERLEEQRERLDRERISLQIVIEDDQTAFKQMFVDIADNALGITSAVRIRFDARKVVNRSVEPMLKHALLDKRVDLEQDRIGASNPNLLGARHVADLIRTVAVGIDGRIGKRLEDELREDALVEETTRFLDTLLEAFPALAQIADGELAPGELRKTSLLGASTMLRVLAGVYHELREQELEDEEIASFYATLDPHMAAPVAEESIWVANVPGEIFTPGASAPRSRRQDLRQLTDTITSWAMEMPEWLALEHAVATA